MAVHHPFPESDVIPFLIPESQDIPFLIPELGDIHILITESGFPYLIPETGSISNQAGNESEGLSTQIIILILSSHD